MNDEKSLPTFSRRSYDLLEAKEFGSEAGSIPPKWSTSAGGRPMFVDNVILLSLLTLLKTRTVQAVASKIGCMQFGDVIAFMSHESFFFVLLVAVSWWPGGNAEDGNRHRRINHRTFPNEDSKYFHTKI